MHGVLGPHKTINMASVEYTPQKIIGNECERWEAPDHVGPSMLCERFGINFLFWKCKPQFQYWMPHVALTHIISLMLTSKGSNCLQELHKIMEHFMNLCVILGQEPC